jgi:hypothetical protein
MSPIKPKKIKPVKKSKYVHNPKEDVYQVPDPAISVAPGETVEILIPGSEGFTVYLPIGEHFNAQIFEAVENPEWALEEMEAVPGSSSESAAKKFWGVQMTRISNSFITKENPKGEFPYCIYSKELKNFAVGNSPPKMNLKP